MAVDIEKLRELAVSGMIVNEIAKTLGVTRQRIHQLCKQHSITLTSRGVGKTENTVVPIEATIDQLSRKTRNDIDIIRYTLKRLELEVRILNVQLEQLANIMVYFDKLKSKIK